jgi:methionyl-tRNA formyltransferase
VKLAAQELGLPVLQPQRLRGDETSLQATLAQLRAWAPDVMVVVAYGLILPRALLELPRLGCLNIHASLLPRWRGAAPIQRAILAGDAVSGVSIMQMDEGLDTGGVLCSASVPIGAECTAAMLHDQLAALGAAQILVALEGVASGELQAQPQAADGASYAAKLGKSEARIDWQGDAVQIDRRIRAFNPWPGAEARLDGEAVKLWRSRVAPGRSAPQGTPPGTLLGLQDGALEVACGRGVLQLLELQRAGRRALGAREFFNALRPAAGSSVVLQ